MNPATAFWQAPRGTHTEAWIEDYRSSVDAEYRNQVVLHVGTFLPGGEGSVLEVGCHCGPMLTRLLDAYPEMQAYGIDCNTAAIAAGQRFLSHYGRRAWLVEGDFPAVTQSKPDGCVDVVLSCYAMAYVTPAQLSLALEEAIRLARRGVVLMEPCGGGEEIKRGDYTEWRHPYDLWLEEIVPGRWTRHDLRSPEHGLNAVMVVEKES